MSIEKFTIATDEALRARIAHRVADYQWFAAPQLAPTNAVLVKHGMQCVTLKYSTLQAAL